MSRAILAGAGDGRISRDRAAVRIALGCGLVFIIAGLQKFVLHGAELRAFRSFGLPWPAALEIFAGVVEVGCGVLLALRRWVGLSALLLAATMVVAIASSGIGHGDVIPSLTLAPALLAAMLYLLWVCGGARSAGTGDDRAHPESGARPL